MPKTKLVACNDFDDEGIAKDSQADPLRCPLRCPLRRPLTRLLRRPLRCPLKPPPLSQRVPQQTHYTKTPTKTRAKTPVKGANPGVLWKKAPRAIRAMRGKTLQPYLLRAFQPYSGCTKSFPKVLSAKCFQARKAMRAKRAVTVPLQPYFGFLRRPLKGRLRGGGQGASRWASQWASCWAP